ncbi:restriction endonuclease subunit S [Streptomyces sp. NPDC057555]|uniref:restriction endonuclease subunit S n=1 Tax=Streptomyces sp. NPDC057555 TaxID=3346166 RepID=UPI00367CCBF6
MSLSLDKTAWKRVTLRDVVRHVTDRVDAETSGLERFLAGEHIPSGSLAITDWGVIGRDPIGPMFYKRFKPGHVLYVSRRTYLRKVAVPEFEGITGEKTFVLETLDENLLLQEFLPFVLSAERFHAYAIAHSRGSVNPYLNWGELAAYEFDLPPLDEQKRLADLLWALERHRVELDGQVSAVEAALQHFLADSFRTAPGPQIKIVDLCTHVIGGIWGSPEGKAEVDVLALGPRVYSDGATQLATDGSPVRSVSRRQAEVRLVRDGDIILERSGGSPSQPVGRVVVARGELAPCVPTDFQRLLRPNPEVVEPRFLFWRLRHDWAAGVTRDYAKKTTNITNLSVKDYIARSIAVPSLANQIQLLGRVASFEDTLASVIMEKSELAALRRSLHEETFRGGE